ncbi:MAG: SDR family oxidoreductase [Armatimonadetes bacterium]|nr:SDR family oxidoreductase [Armatimonadota bacterium]MBS1726369.1 SDR family oxidoreductase [Armatimonadota bacterium]
MRVFVTGATGFIGQAVVRDLIDAGHEVFGLARKPESAATLEESGARALLGDIEDFACLAEGAKASDAVIHTAFIHDFTRFAECCEADRKAIGALGEAMVGTDKPLIVTSGMVGGNEDNDAPTPSASYPRASEPAAFAFLDRGVRAMAIRLPQVHDREKQGLITFLIEVAKQKGESAYMEGMDVRWAAAHRFDAARLYLLALEKGVAGGRYHAVAEEGVPLREIAEIVGQRLGIPVVAKKPEEAPAHFGFLGHFMGLNLRGSSELTRARLGWSPTGPDLLDDLRHATNLELS